MDAFELEQNKIEPFIIPPSFSSTNLNVPNDSVSIGDHRLKCLRVAALSLCRRSSFPPKATGKIKLKLFLNFLYQHENILSVVLGR